MNITIHPENGRNGDTGVDLPFVPARNTTVVIQGLIRQRSFLITSDAIITVDDSGTSPVEVYVTAWEING